ncbi:MAG: glycosyltransferase family 2 protein [Desulfomonilaceae bacterium]
MKYSIVIPCFNEVNTIAEVLRRVRQSPLEPKEIIVVDDCSTIHNKQIVVYPTIIGISALAGFIAIYVLDRHKRKHAPSFADWVLLAPPVIGLVYWFFTAPDPRFAHSLFWLFSIGSLLVLLLCLYQMLGTRVYVAIVCATLIVTNVIFWNLHMRSLAK